VEFGKSNLISKARQQPEKVKQVLDKIKTDGLMSTLEAVFNKLDEPLPLGYCNAGEVVEVGEGINEFKIGDRVVSNGPHAEYVSIPKNLCARIPDNVSYEDAAFTVIGSIGLQGIRLIQPTFGEVVVVIGLGLIGLITAELLVANGCIVLGFDFDDQKVKIAEQKGVKAYNSGKGVDPVKTVEDITNNIGADAVIITASTKSNDVISQSANMCRQRGRIVLVGVVGLDINRTEFYKKELSFQVSCSYGPGRYDENYESRGIDYPLAFVRWTEQRNFQAILQAISSSKLNVSSLITERVELQNYKEIYNNMGGSSIASILEYDTTTTYSPETTVKVIERNFAGSKGVIGIIGAGNFTKMTMLPALKNTGAGFKYVASAGGVTAIALARKFGFSHSTTDYRQIVADPEVDLVLITTRHNLHATMVIETLKSGKHVFVEKPLAITQTQLNDVLSLYNTGQNGVQLKSVSVGFNRRFSPHIQKVKELIGNSDMPINMIATMNAGFIPPEIWVHDLSVGGGRIIGEACHFIDLMIYINGSKVLSVNMSALGNNPSEKTDNAIITLKFENGSQGVVNYFANGSKAYAKERIEVYAQGKTLIVDNFRKTEGFGFKRFSSIKTKLDKGHKRQFELLVRSVKEGGPPLIPFDEIVNTTQASFAAIESLKQNCLIKI
jgi:predicted dehydrogenase/threonine dehydrogenase-like Zn-dependent dehydrogenase